MCFVADWASPDRRSLIHIAAAVLDVLAAHRQLDNQAPEGGGILLGKVRGLHLEVLAATSPTKYDLRSRYAFERLPQIHAELAVKAWARSGGLIRYLGDWHSHPQDLPVPSSIDRREWWTLAAQRQDGRPALAVIAGRKHLHVELVTSTGLGVACVPVRELEDPSRPQSAERANPG